MMTTRRSGFTLVELLVVAVLAAVILGAAFQSLIVHERTNRTTGEVIRGQDALRTALGILESELREVATMGGDSIGVPDIVFASADSIVIRAQRKLGFVCAVIPPDWRRLAVWSVGPDRFAVGDGVTVFADGDTASAGDDRWLPAQVSSIQSSSVACPSRPGAAAVAQQRIDLGTLPGGPTVADGFLDDVWPGAPVRGFQRVTYGIYSFDGEWGLGRREATQTLPMVVGLAGPGTGLVFQYLDRDGAVITASPVPPADVAAVRVRAVTRPREGSGASPVEVTSNIFFRNN